MSGLISHLNADELATCFMGRRRSKRDRTWLADTMERLNASFQSDGDDGFEWIIAHAMCLFRQLRNSSNVVALACLCVSSKLLDDRCPEIGDGAWETQLPGLTVAEMVAAENYVVHTFGFHLRRTKWAVQCCVEDCAVEADIAVRV